MIVSSEPKWEPSAWHAFGLFFCLAASPIVAAVLPGKGLSMYEYDFWHHVGDLAGAKDKVNEAARKGWELMDIDLDGRTVLVTMRRETSHELVASDERALRIVPHKLEDGELEKLKEWAKKNGVPVIDATPAEVGKGPGQTVGQLTESGGEEEGGDR